MIADMNVVYFGKLAKFTSLAFHPNMYVCMCVYVCVGVRACVRMYVVCACMYVIYVRTYLRMFVCLF
jgi:hypothetical protein